MPRRSCSRGKIKRLSYNKRPYSRRSYRRYSRSGKRVSVKAARISRTHVRETCVPATGKARYRGRKTLSREKVLPRPSTLRLSLRKYGYKTSASAAVRQAALNRAVRSAPGGDLEVLRHLNVIRNYEPYTGPKKTMAEDIEYVSKMHGRSMARMGLPVRSKYMSRRSQSRSRSRKSRGSRKSRKSRKSRRSRRGSKK